MSRSLHVIQTTAKVTHIVCRVLRVLAIIGTIGSLVGFVLLLALQGVSIGGETVAAIVERKEGVPIGAAIVSCLTGAVSSAAAFLVLHVAIPYLSEELADGTPFTASGALHMRKLGIVATVVPLCRETLNGILSAIFTLIYPAADIVYGGGADIGGGLLLILLSFVFAYGAERDALIKEEENANND